MVNITSCSRRTLRTEKNMRTRYEPRIYRRTCQSQDLVSFSVVIRETDLFILAEKNLQEQARKAALECRRILDQYIARNPLFLKSLIPLPDDPKAPSLVSSMILAARKARVGPMAAVAGAIAEFVGRELLNLSSQVVVENGGDIFLQSSQTRTILILAGKSALSGRIALEIEAEQSPLGICTSSGICGHSLSFGCADAVVILSPSTALADAAATAIGNIVQTRDDMDTALQQAQAIEGIDGAVLLKDDSAGFWGKVKITGAHHARDSL
jgi:ApbE superfamily uncharacterized protein (UPF0280 family)